MVHTHGIGLVRFVRVCQYETAELLLRDGSLRIEVCGVYVFCEAVAQVFYFRCDACFVLAVGCVRCEQVDACHYNASFAKFGFKDCGKTAVVDKVVDSFDYRRCSWYGVDMHGLAALYNAPPLPVGVFLGREVTEGRMCVVDEQSHRTCLFREVDRTPEYREELAFDALDVVRRKRQDDASTFSCSA